MKLSFTHLLMQSVACALFVGLATISSAEDDLQDAPDLLSAGKLTKHFNTAGNWSLTDDAVAFLQPRAGETDWTRYDCYLWTKHQYRDFDFQFEYKHNKGGNSGLYFNVTDPDQAVGSVIEVQIIDSAGKKKLGAHGTAGGILPGVDPSANAAKPAGQWNTLRTKSEKGQVTVWLNGQIVNQVALESSKLASKPKQGYIGIQDHGIPFWVRNIKVVGEPVK